MDHLRQQILEAVETAVTGLTTTGANVFRSRVYTLQSSNLPALRLSLGSESVEPWKIHNPPTQDRKLQVEVNCVCQAVANLDDELNQIIKEVEIAVAAMSLSGLAASMQLLSVDRPDFEQGSQPIGQTTLIYEVNYYTAANAPDTEL